MSKYISKVYNILISRDLKNQKVDPIHHPHRPPKYKEVSALKSEILIKYMRIKWTPSYRASLLLPGG